MTYDARLMYICGGVGQFSYAGELYDLEKGDLLLWNPAVEYGLRIRKGDNLNIIAINFDYTNDASRILPKTISPSRSSVFNYSRIHEFCVFKDNEAMNKLIWIKNMQEEESLLARIMKEHQFLKTNYLLKSRSMFLSLLARIVTVISMSCGRSGSDSAMDEILDYIQDNCTEQLTNKTIGEMFNFNHVYLARLIKECTGYPTHKYLLYCRIRKALDLMHFTDKTIAEISYETGFEYYNNFSSCFRKFTGMSPRQYIKSGNP
ncbi:MAG: AraC family transcriptional regulator [Eubacteriales bacterium]|nr:AraC family transcriptional regulator [Eubacteriales bacterium]